MNDMSCYSWIRRGIQAKVKAIGETYAGASEVPVPPSPPPHPASKSEVIMIRKPQMIGGAVSLPEFVCVGGSREIDFRQVCFISGLPPKEKRLSK